MFSFRVPLDKTGKPGYLQSNPFDDEGGDAMKRVLLLVLGALLLACPLTCLAEEPESTEEVLVEPTPAPTALPTLRYKSSGENVKTLQKLLADVGLYTGSIDGKFGSGTRTAVKKFQKAQGLEADGIVGQKTWEALQTAAAEARANATPTPEPLSGEDLWYTPDGLPRLINSTHPLPEDYAPVELVNLTEYCDSSVVKIKASGIEGERVAVDALLVMLRAAQADGLQTWQVSACYRSVSYQTKLFNNRVAAYQDQGLSKSKAIAATKKAVAEPGCSEHHTGLAFDITVPGTSFGSTKQAEWLKEHCWEYGFILRYQADKTEITGISNEPWHIRYVGVEHSLVMRDENLCLEEYVEKYGTWDYGT